MGMIFTALSGLMLGKSGAKKLWDRAALLRELAVSVKLLKAHLEARQAMGHICRELSGQGGQAGAFFGELGKSLESLGETGLGQAWADCAEQVLGKDRELLPFYNIGMALSTGQSPMESIDACVRQLERSADKATDRAERDGNMFVSLGLAVGAAVALVLV